MKNKINFAIVAFLFTSIVPGCSMLRRKPDLQWRLTVEIPAETPDLSNAMNVTRKVLETRLDRAGVTDFSIQPEAGSTNRLVISLPGGRDPEKLKRLITSQGKLELFHVMSPPSPSAVETFATEAEGVNAVKDEKYASWKVLPYLERDATKDAPKKFVVLQVPPIVEGSDIRNASAAPDGQNYAVSFALKPAGAEKLSSWTDANKNEYLAVALNNEVKSIAFIKARIYDQAQITGRFTQHSAEELAIILNSGSLPVPITLVAEVFKK